MTNQNMIDQIACHQLYHNRTPDQAVLLHYDYGKVDDKLSDESCFG